jgi:hypothetical protein
MILERIPFINPNDVAIVFIEDTRANTVLSFPVCVVTMQATSRSSPCAGMPSPRQIRGVFWGHFSKEEQIFVIFYRVGCSSDGETRNIFTTLINLICRLREPEECQD